MTTFTNHRILIIDDNPAIHHDIRKILQAEKETAINIENLALTLFGEKKKEPLSLTPNFEIDSAFQGEEGLAYVREAINNNKPYALVIIDVRMPPGWDGIETISRIWEIDKNIQTVICTAFSDYSWTEINKRLGHTDRLLILKKPFDNIEILQLASTLTKKWELAQASKNR